MNLLFVGDLHLDSQTPISRIDNYRETTINKLNSLLSLSKQENVSHVIFSGDIFDKYDQSISYLNAVIAALLEFKNNGITLYSVIGNHDLPHNNMDYFSSSTPLNILFMGGIIKHLIKESIGVFDLYGIDFTKEEEIESIRVNNNKINILTMHYATDNTVPGESVPRSRLKNFDVVLSGHDHSEYETVENNIKGYKIPILLRPGSFTRRTKEEYNLNRNICVYKIDAVSLDIARLELPNVLRAEDVFKNSVFVGDSINLYNNKYSSLFNKNHFSKSSVDVIGIIESLPPTVSAGSIKHIKRKLKEAGVK